MTSTTYRSSNGSAAAPPAEQQQTGSSDASRSTSPQPDAPQHNPRSHQKGLIVQFDQVSKTYQNQTQALENINLQVRQGDFLFITGPSGSGKSTLLKLMYGQERATSGEIKVQNYDLKNLRGHQLAQLRRRIGVVFQDYKLIPRRTVMENVAFVLWAQGFTRKEIQRRLEPTLKMVGLYNKAKCFPDELSGGEQQRVSIARAVVGTPPLLLADEPTGNLDPDNSWQIMKILKKLNSIGITVIVTTHDEHLVRLSNQPVMQLRHGHLLQVRR